MQLSEREPLGIYGVSHDGKHLLILAARTDGALVYSAISITTCKVEREYPMPSTAWYDPTWMPNNRSVAVQDLRSGTYNLWVLPILEEGSEKQLTHYTAGEGAYVQYSPDGKWVVMERGPGIGNAVLFREAGK